MKASVRRNYCPPSQIRIEHKTIPYISNQLETGKFKPVIDREYLLEDISKAYEYVIKGEKTGNVLINFIFS